jgi:nucleoside-diphosphate-sugar epimerase
MVHKVVLIQIRKKECFILKDLEINTSKPVMVTGATGYVAGWIMKELLEKGVTIHAPVRDPLDKTKIQHLLDLENKLPGTIKFFKADLLKEGSYEEAMAGCEVVFHTASPFKLNVKDPQKELIEPALMGTKNVLNQVNQTPSVKRVVLTSSCVAVFGDNTDVSRTKNGVFTEEDWNETSSADYQPYYYSKTLAEKEAWRIADKQDRWKLVAINPHFVMGPGIRPTATSESFAFMKDLTSQKMAAGVPDIGLGLVDVRDVAIMHMNAAFHPKAHGRYLTFSDEMTLWEMVKVLKSKYGTKYRLPARKLPKILAWLLGPILDKTVSRRMIQKNVGVRWMGDNSKSKTDFGMSYRDPKNTLVDMFDQLIEAKEIMAGLS